MASKIRKRLPEVKTLYELLPKGVEGGKEFARIVDLLLFHEARRAGKKVTVFSDAAGDYHGLDSFAGDSFRKEGTTGYQYKFYPSPLSATHRSEIVDSIQLTAAKQKELRLKKWILVTPQDLTQSATRKDGGDVAWFEGLRSKLKLKFELEHIGHRKLISLFLENPTLSLFYYPELVLQGSTRRKTIQDTRKRYDENLIGLYRDIQFVGMPVYKPETGRGVPMEHIYIPLTVVPESSDEKDSNVPRTNPLTFLAPGTQRVILGDPGSGKSTLLRFLALAGISSALQTRYQAKADNRLPVFIILRRYADELKSRANLSLIDYIQESIQGDFSLKSANLDFFEYYLENAQAILLFDGLDELPDSHFKETVKNRIRALITTYPGNTALVTSRIVGYETPFRFDEKEFGHHRLTRLQLPEIKQFVEDWYRVRVENERERQENVNDLIRILQHEDHAAIRELAENPLLLTIVALVHRIDAVLPDERVVLYKKCTETLLNTWHTSKYREGEVKNKGKVDRRNRQRMEVIAHWMHCQSLGTGKNQRAVVPYDNLKKFLTTHIEKVEKTVDPDKEAEDLASDFLEFVKKRAGLLIELGDNQYSFVHLTFQEYLTASHIKTSSEKDGAAKIWKTIESIYHNPRWHEVIRLLIAGLESNESQQFLIEQIISEEAKEQQLAKAQLLGGLLLDGVEAAEARQEDILRELLLAASAADNLEQLKPTNSMLRTWLTKEENNREILNEVLRQFWAERKDKQQRLSLLLVATALGFSEDEMAELTGDFLDSKDDELIFFKLFFRPKTDATEFRQLLGRIEELWISNDVMFLSAGAGAFVSQMCHSITNSLEPLISSKRYFEQQLAGMVYPRGPFYYNNFFGTRMFSDRRSSERSISMSRKQRLGDRIERHISGAFLKDVFVLAHRLVQSLPKKPLWTIKSFNSNALYSNDNKSYWENVIATSDFDDFLEYLTATLGLLPQPQWSEAINVAFIPTIPSRNRMYDESTWRNVEQAFESGEAGETEIYRAAWLLLLDIYFYFIEDYNLSYFKRLADLTRDSDAPALRIAHCLRDLAYGDIAKAVAFRELVNSDDPAYRSIFERSYWRDPQEKKKRPSQTRAKKQAKKAAKKK